MKSLLGLVGLGLSYAADWAVLLAGSRTYGNYRHQSDTCHAYKVVNKFGIPDERVIVMQYDDIASNPSNPFPGQIFNKPTAVGTPGVDVYAGCKKDYTGAAVTPDMFVAVMTGDASKTGGRPVLKSGPSDRVFIFFTDHGGTGIIAFPDGSLMSSTTLVGAIKQMYASHMYSHLVFYMEACESGSMFEGLLSSNIGVYVTTASNAVESSWGTYCPPDDMVNGKAINSCLGDLYSINWMENADQVGPTETLQAQYIEVKAATTQSHVMQYGDLTWTSEPIGNYLGGNSTKTPFVPVVSKSAASSSNVKSADIPMHLAYYKYLRADATNFEERAALAKELQQHIARRVAVDQIFMDLATAAGTQDSFVLKAKMPVVCDGRCCEKLSNAYAKSCGGFDDYSLQYHRVIVNVCAAINHQPATADMLVSKLTSMCA
jgi:legumain